MSKCKGSLILTRCLLEPHPFHQRPHPFRLLPALLHLADQDSLVLQILKGVVIVMLLSEVVYISMLVVGNSLADVMITQCYRNVEHLGNARKVEPATKREGNVYLRYIN